MTHSGHISEYELLKEATNSYKIPITFMFGNHDNRSNFTKVFPDVSLTSEGHLQKKIVLGNDVLFCLDTLNSDPHFEREHEGKLCEKRLKWLEQELIQVKNKRVSIFTHHPPHNIGFPGMDKIKLSNSADLFNIIKKYQNIKHIFSGHIHRLISGTTNNIGFTIFKSTCHQMPMDLLSVGSSLSVAEPAAYGIVLFDDQSIIAHTEDYQIALLADASNEDAMPDKL
jgi:3',5'-cyclic AMP phosphodiesterase CpdA